MVGTVVVVGADSADRSVTAVWELCCHSAKAADPPMPSRTVIQTTMMSMRPGDVRAPLSMLFPVPLMQPGNTQICFSLLCGAGIKSGSESAQDWINLWLIGASQVPRVLLLNRESIVWRREGFGV